MGNDQNTGRGAKGRRRRQFAALFIAAALALLCACCPCEDPDRDSDTYITTVKNGEWYIMVDGIYKRVR